MAAIAGQRIVLCGAGALGSVLADNLVRQGFRHIRVIDHDRVEAQNVNTQVYGLSEVGGFKAEVLRNRLFREVQVEVESITKRLDVRNVAKLVRGADVIVDVFDNAESRRCVQEHCRATELECLHVGLSADYGEIIWDEGYRVPNDVGDDVCAYPMARNIVVLTATVASEVLMRFAITGEKSDYSITLKDFSVQAMPTGCLPSV